MATFVLTFVAVVVAIVLAGSRWALTRAESRRTPPDLLARPYDIAYLGGEHMWTTFAALAALLARGSVVVAEGHVVAVQDPPADVDAIEQAVHAVATTPTPLDHLRWAPEVHVAAGRIADRLVEAGLLLTPERGWEVERRMRLSGWAVLGTTVAAAVLAYGILLRPPFGSFWDGALVVALSFTVVPICFRTTPFLGLRRSHGAERALRRLRRAQRASPPRTARVTDPGHAALAVALFGLPALAGASDDVELRKLAAGGGVDAGCGGGCGGCGGG